MLAAPTWDFLLSRPSFSLTRFELAKLFRILRFFQRFGQMARFPVRVNYGPAKND